MASSDDTGDPAALREQLADANAQLAEAMEEVAFHREQLRSTQAFHEHLLRLERARHRLARRVVARNLAAVMARLTRDGHALETGAGGGADGTHVMQPARSTNRAEGN